MLFHNAIRIGKPFIIPRVPSNQATKQPGIINGFPILMVALRKSESHHSPKPHLLNADNDTTDALSLITTEWGGMANS